VQLKKWRLHSIIEDMTLIAAAAQKEAVPTHAKR
jgi:hypothetical protein